MRQTLSLDGSGWQIRAHLGLEAALAAVRRAGDTPDGEAEPAAIHAVHLADGDAAGRAGDGAGGAGGWLPAHVPGSILDDLWRAGQIPDPYHEQNSLLSEWVPQRAWTYRRTVELPAARPGERLGLRFHGIDHAGHVFVDGRAVGRHEGMFVPFEVEIDPAVADGRRHELAVVVEPAPPSEPQVGRTSNVRIHKARMGYGWDFCPRLVHQGLWQSVELVRAGKVRIADVWARPLLDENLAAATVVVRVLLDAAAGAPARTRLVVSLDSDPSAAAEATVESSAGPAELRFRVDRPALWWPNGHGLAALHRLAVHAFDGDELIDSSFTDIGFRRIGREANAGGPVAAAPWTFVVNDRPIEITGWNWTPVDALYGVPNRDRREHLLRLARASHANLVRVWGGGLIETEDFYAACDRLGLLVWQEFSQSSSGIDNIPSDDAVFVARMRAEAEAIVPLRRNHPSLAVWCGGNELQDADGTPLTDDRSAVLRALHEAVAHLDPDRIWLPTSPSGPRFGNRLSEIELDPDGLHDVHGPWEHQGLHDQTTLWDRGTSLFNSEFGVEGMTNRRAHERLISPERRWPADRSNPVYRHLGDWWNNAPLVEASFGGRLGDLEALRRASQHLQAEGLRYAVEANRRRWPRNSGSIPWQLNESYPNAWCTSVIDHGGEPKPAFFAVARAFAPSVVCASFASSVLDDAASLEATIWAWSRDGSVAEGTVGWRIAGLDGRVVANGGQAVDLDGGFPVRIPGPAAVAIPDDAGPIVFLDLVLEDAGGVARARNRYLFALGADLAALTQLPPANVAITAVERGDDWCVRLEHHGGPAAVAVVIADARPGDVAGWPELADNAFDLLPGEAREVAVHWAAAPPGPRTLRVAGWNVAESIVP